MPEVVAQETRERYWHADDWRQLIADAVDSVFGSADAARDPRHLNSENRLRWACSEIGQVKHMLHDKIGAVDKKIDSELKEVKRMLAALSKKLDVDNTTESHISPIEEMAISKKVANILKGSRAYTRDPDVTAEPASQSTGALEDLLARAKVVSATTGETQSAAPAPQPRSTRPGKGAAHPAPPLPSGGPENAPPALVVML